MIDERIRILRDVYLLVSGQESGERIAHRQRVPQLGTKRGPCASMVSNTTPKIPRRILTTPFINCSLILII